MERRKNVKWIVILLGICAAVAFGQSQTYRLQSDMLGSAGLSLEFWKAKKDNITEFAIPMTFIYPYSDKLRFYAITSPAFCTLNTSETYSLGGMSDLKWGGHYLAFDDQWLVNFGMNLPTGKSALADEEYPVASVLTLPALNFRVPSLGQGFDLLLGISTARQVGEFVVGGGVSYLMKGSFKPFKGYDEGYNPGDEITLMAGVDRTLRMFDRDVKITGDMLYTVYFTDTWGGEKVFHSGNKFTLQVLSSFRVSSLDMLLFIRESKKGKNRIGSGDIFETERKNSNGNQFEIQTIGYYPYTQDLRLKGIFEIRLYAANDYDTGGATLLGLGGGGQLRLTPRMVFDGDVRFYFGSIKTGSDAAGTFGLKLFGGVQYTF